LPLTYAIGLYYSTSSSTPASSNPFPSVIEFDDLDQPESLKAAREALSGLVGVYAIICNITGAIYIGSSINIGNRLVDHLVDNSTNEHLQNAIAKYGLSNFTFAVVELCVPEVFLLREQHYLDILFTLPANLRYNFNSTASSMLGYKHTPESLAKMSNYKYGANNPMYGRTGIPSQSSYVW